MKNIALLCMMLAISYGQSTWSNGVNGTWDSANAWGNRGVPTDSAIINAAGSFVVAINSPVTLSDSLTLGGSESHPTLLITGTTLHVATINLISGTLLVMNGTVVVSNSIVVNTAGTAFITSINGQIQAETTTIAEGQLQLGGNLALSGTYNTASGSTLLLSGSHTSTNCGFQGNGVVSVSGSFTLSNLAFLKMPTFFTLAGGLFACDASTVTTALGSFMTTTDGSSIQGVALSVSQLAVTGNFNVESYATLAGDLLNATSGSINVMGQLNINDPGATLVGSFNIQNGGQALLVGITWINGNLNNTGSVSFAQQAEYQGDFYYNANPGATLYCSGRVYGSENSIFHANGVGNVEGDFGKLSVEGQFTTSSDLYASDLKIDGGVLTATQGKIFSNGTLVTNTGAMIVSAGNNFTSHGNLVVNASSQVVVQGGLSVSGSLLLGAQSTLSVVKGYASAAVLTMDVTSTYSVTVFSTTTSMVLNVVNNAQLAGALVVDVDPSFTFAGGQTQTVMTYGTRTGTFSPFTIKRDASSVSYGAHNATVTKGTDSSSTPSSTSGSSNNNSPSSSSSSSGNNLTSSSKGTNTVTTSTTQATKTTASSSQGNSNSTTSSTSGTNTVSTSMNQGTNSSSSSPSSIASTSNRRTSTTNAIESDAWTLTCQLAILPIVFMALF